MCNVFKRFPKTIGVNYPWGSQSVTMGRKESYGWDFGDPFGAGKSYWHTSLEEDLEVFEEHKLELLRWFVLGNGMSYGRIGLDLIESDYQQEQSWSFNPPRIPAEGEESLRLDLVHLRQDLTKALRIIEGSKTKIIPVFIDGQTIAKPGQDINEVLAGGRISIFTDSVIQDKFMKNCLEPLLEASSFYSNAIAAWELINEPEALLEYGICYEDVNRFLTRGINTIKSFKKHGASVFDTTIGYQYLT